MTRSAVAQARLDAVRARAEVRRAPVPLSDVVALRSVGFDPVCEVIGAVSMVDARGGFYASGWFSLDHTAPRTYTTSPPSQRVGVPATLTTIKTGFARAFARLVDEASALGAHGVLGVRVDTRRESITGAARGAYDVVVRGVAVRALGEPRPAVPFTTSLSGPQVASALRGGLVPVRYLQAAVMGVRHVDPVSARQLAWAAPNGEVEAFTDLLKTCRDAARRDFETAARNTGAEFAVVDDVAAELHGGDQRGGLHSATAVVTGTALASFRPPTSRPGPLSVLPLSGLIRR